MYLIRICEIKYSLVGVGVTIFKKIPFPVMHVLSFNFFVTPYFPKIVIGSASSYRHTRHIW